MQNGDAPIREWYVVFKRRPKTKWFYRWLDEYFRHVTLLRESDCGEYWIIVDTVGGNIYIDFFPICAIRDLYPSEVIVKFTTTKQKEPYFKFWHYNCVELAKVILGIRNIFIITPRQLYTYISRSPYGNPGTTLYNEATQR